LNFEVKELLPKYVKGAAAVAVSLPAWFDVDSRLRAIPIDLRHQDGFVALDSEQVIGFITLFVAEGRVNIGWMGVHPDYHHQGVGSALIGAAEDYCKQKGIEELATYTLGDSVEYEPYDSTRAFYDSLGFEIYQRSQTDNPSCPEEIKLKKAVD
jgi:GNAT superfamily N-acetyltransferase